MYNQYPMFMASNLMINKRSKYIHMIHPNNECFQMISYIEYHMTRDHIADNISRLEYHQNDVNIVDVMTKALEKVEQRQYVKMLL